MAKKAVKKEKNVHAASKPSALLDTRVIYCGDNLEQLKKFPDQCVDLIYIDPPFNWHEEESVGPAPPYATLYGATLRGAKLWTLPS